MKLHSSTHVVEKSGNFEENQFSIEASAKAFMISVRWSLFKQDPRSNP